MPALGVAAEAARRGARAGPAGAAAALTAARARAARPTAAAPPAAAPPPPATPAAFEVLVRDDARHGGPHVHQAGLRDALQQRPVFPSSQEEQQVG
eukprot:CAMPEP_0202872484 /NCGR_PEP_ID=MMETSP1391-20130828/21313_1 /ASSEMBLY_ACC=CAM_ASM_000867 /TAXON_ID=1034604 /ORGANISM="Chlamydomonas leiostraca, Strain SAG 11-49" /LENGTH=95 /DNA_ID=CAMNT_0049553533 /DNA_START=479 /DNA_END=768 /DNA_ORIENTATION=-